MKNIEWNLSYKTLRDNITIIDIVNEFNYLWENTLQLEPKLIENYKLQLDYAIEKWDMDYFEPEQMTIKPNSMQKKALKEIRRYRDLGVKKSLIISATWFRVIIVTVANSLGIIRVFELLPKLKTKNMVGVLLRSTRKMIVVVSSAPAQKEELVCLKSLMIR